MAVAPGSGPRSVYINQIVTFAKLAWADRRIRILIGVAAIAIASAWYWFASSSATLTIAGRHGFRHAEVSIWIDGDLKSTYEVSGSAKKKFGVLQKIEGTFSHSLRVGSGDHIVKVRFHSLTDSSDITRQVGVSVEARTESTVYVNADRGILSLAFAGAAPKTRSEPEPSNSYAKMFQSIFMAIAGSVLSATVGFVVQDFLKSRKAAKAAS